AGVDYVAGLLAAGQDSLNGNPWDNAPLFQNIEVPQGKNGKPGRFSVIALRYPDDPNAASAPFRYGVIDGSGKLHLNALLARDNGRGDAGGRSRRALPNMTERVANAIIDWIAPDQTPRTSGAEDEYYSTLSPPYHAKNGPLDTLEELLLVKGVTPQLLFGNDRNRNGILDPDEDDGSGQANT